MNQFLKIAFYTVFAAGLTFMIAKGACEEYISSLKKTGGMVQATDIWEMQVLPYIIAGIVGYIIIWLFKKPSSNQ